MVSPRRDGAGDDGELQRIELDWRDAPPRRALATKLRLLEIEGAPGFGRGGLFGASE